MPAVIERYHIFLIMCFILALGIVPRESQALLIDNFSTAQGPLFDTSSGADPIAQYQSAVSGSGIAGGERDTRVLADTFSPVEGAVRFEANGGLASASADVGSQGQVRLDYDGVGDPLDLISPLSIDLTDGGASDRFIFDISSVTGVVGILVNVGLTGGQQALFFQSQGGSWTDVSLPGKIELPFSNFLLVGTGPLPQPSFDSAQQVAFFLAMNGGEAIGINAFCTGAQGSSCNTPGGSIPEPSTFLLMILALAGLIFCRYSWSFQRNLRPFIMFG